MKFSPFIYSMIYTLSMMSLFSSCSTDFDEKKDDPEVEETDDSKIKMNRTILVYMDANSTLSGFDNYDLDEMKFIASSGSLKGNRLIVYHHRKNQNNEVYLKRFNLVDGSIDTVATYSGSVPAVSTSRMKEVIADMKKISPSDDYGIIFWGHGDGGVTYDGSSVVSSKSSKVSPLGYGGEFNNGGGNYLWINNSDIADCLKDEEFSFIYFDACFMASIEGVYDYRNVTDYMIVSAAEVMDLGMPYHECLPKLFSTGNADLIGTIQAHMAYIDSDNSYYGTYALVKMDELEELGNLTKTLYSFKPYLDHNIDIQRFSNPNQPSYNTPRYFYDFGQIIENLQVESNDASILQSFMKAKEDVLAQLEKAVVYKDCSDYVWPGSSNRRFKINHFSGLTMKLNYSAAEAVMGGYDKTEWWNEIGKYQFD